MILSPKVSAALNAKLSQVLAPAENLERIGTLAEFIEHYNCSAISKVRQNEGKRPYIVLRTSENKPIVLMFSSAVTKKHDVEPYTALELKDNPVYMTESTLEDGSVANIFSIGVDQRDDWETVDFAEFGIKQKAATPKPAGARR